MYCQSLGTIASRLQTDFNDSTGPVQGGASATWLRKQWHFERAGFCLEAQGNVFRLPASSHIKWSLFCSRLQQWREGRMDGSPSTITFISHLLRCEQDASELCKINWGLFSYETQTEGKVITMTFLTSLKPFLHLLVGPSRLFSSLRVTNKYLIDVRCCAAAGLQPTWRFRKKHLRLSLDVFYLHFPNIVLSPCVLANSWRWYIHWSFLGLTKYPHIYVSISLKTT